MLCIRHTYCYNTRAAYTEPVPALVERMPIDRHGAKSNKYVKVQYRKEGKQRSA